jgi:hypothetical protein
MPVYRDDLVGDYINNGYLYTIRLADGKPIAVYEYDQKTENLTAATRYTGAPPQVIENRTGASAAEVQKRADAVLKKYFEAHPRVASPSSEPKP